MPQEIYLVKVGMTMTEGMVSEWYVGDGEPVNRGDLLYALETEKINMDVDAETSGIVRHRVDVGVTLEPGDVVGFIFAEGEDIPDDVKTLPVEKKELEPIEADEPAASSHDTPAAAPVRQSRERVKSSPAARKLAEELGVDLSQVRGSGPGGRIVKGDIERAAESQPAAAGTDSTTSVPLTGMRRTIAERMSSSLRNSAQLTMNMTVGMDEAIKLREQLVGEWGDEGVRPTYTDLVIKAVAKTLPDHRSLNGRFGNDEIILNEDCHIGLAVSLDDGLVVPVIRHANRLSLREVATESARLGAAARAGTLSLDDFAGGTFTISSLGMYGVDSFTPIINEPQAAILGVNRIHDDVEWVDNTPVRVRSMTLSLTWDHRIVDGAPAARFLGDVATLLAEPYRLLV